VGGVSGGVESEMKEGGEGCSIGCSGVVREGGWCGITGYGGDAVTGVGRYEEGTRVGSGVTCKYTVGGVAALMVLDEGGGRS